MWNEITEDKGKAEAEVTYTKKDEQRNTIKEKTAGGQDGYGLKAKEDSADRASIASIGYVPRDREHTLNKDLIRMDFGDSVAAITVQYIHSNLTNTLPRWTSSKEMNTEDTHCNTIERKFYNRQKQIEQRKERKVVGETEELYTADGYKGKGPITRLLLKLGTG